MTTFVLALTLGADPVEFWTLEILAWIARRWIHDEAAWGLEHLGPPRIRFIPINDSLYITGERADDIMWALVAPLRGRFGDAAD